MRDMQTMHAFFGTVLAREISANPLPRATMDLFRRLLLQSLITASMLAALAQSALALDDSMICGQETARQERLQAVPDHLLHAISLVESGRWDVEHKANLAWPWTVNAEGE